MGMHVSNNSVDVLRHECAPIELDLTRENVLSQLNALHAPNPLDDLELHDKMHS